MLTDDILILMLPLSQKVKPSGAFWPLITLELVNRPNEWESARSSKPVVGVE
jgi:hypothetical protein